MKPPIFLTCILIVISTLTSIAQPPEQFTYQAVVRDSNNFIIRNTTIGLRLSVLKDSATSTTPLYSETHNLTTNSNGLITTEIGGGTVDSGDFSSIMWGDGIYFIKTEIDINGGTDYGISGVTRVLSVPYALYSNRSQYSDTSDVTVYSDSARVTSYSQTSGTSSYSDSSRVSFKSNVSDSSGYSIFSDSSRTSGFTQTSLTSGYSDSSGVSGRSDISGSSLYTDSARISGSSIYTDSSRVSGYSDSTRIADTAAYSLTSGYSDSARASIQSDSSIVSERSNYSDSARVARLLPRMTTTQRDSIQNPEQGLQIFNLTTSCLELNMGSATNPEWFQIGCLGTVDSLLCDSTIVSQGLTVNTPTEGRTITIPYTNGNSGDFPEKVFQSQGVSGLSLRLLKGRVRSGDDNLTLEFSGTPQDTGTALFLIDAVTKSCSLEVYVDVARVDSILCDVPTISNQIVEGDSVNSISIQLSYLGGNGGYLLRDTIESTEVLGMTAIIDSGYLSVRDDSIQINLKGFPMGNGVGYFPISIGGQTCSLGIYVIDSSTAYYPFGYVHCDTLNPTEVIEVLNPTTNKIWMDRNLGASRVAQSSTDVQAYGDLFQWGRFADGHQCRDSETTSTRATTAVPNAGNVWDGKFIVRQSGPYDWLFSSNDNLWQGVNGINNPCPAGYRLPTDAEWNTERLSWLQAPINSTNTSAGAFASPLKLPATRLRNYGSGALFSESYYWSSSVGSTVRFLYFYSSGAYLSGFFIRAYGCAVRCIKD